MPKLTKAQKIALPKLTEEWQSSYALQEKRITLDALVRKGYAIRKEELGAMFFPTIHILYRKK